LRILVVDDSPDAADSLTLLLTLQGHEAHTAYDGPSALRLAGTFLPEVVLLDIGLPRMDGCEVARRLRAEVGLRDALLIAATGFGRPADRRRCHEAGFDHFLLKPLDLAELARLLAARQAAPRPKGEPGG
jgi:two-component system CheB/CheR fusion protein